MTQQGKKTYIAKTLEGLEAVLADELEALGATGLRPLRRAVAFDGDLRLMYAANYRLRTALRILEPIRSFSAYNERNLYRAVQETDWSQYMDVRHTLAVDAVVQGEVFTHSHYAALLVKDAIVDQFRDRYGRRPSVDTRSPDLRLNLHVAGTHCDLSLDTSGESLHRRGYRNASVAAPLNEVLAAGMLRIAGWDGQTAFCDPMCGSGTLAIEAALIAGHISPQRLRRHFAFFSAKDFDRALWNVVVAEAKAAERPVNHPIVAADRDLKARNAVALNLMAAGLQSVVQIEKSDFERLAPPAPEGLLATNPPYDERLPVADTHAFYRAVGDTLKQRWQNWDAWLISSNRDALKRIGLRTARRVTLFNGALECSFQHFPMYEGSRKSKFAQDVAKDNT